MYLDDIMPPLTSINKVICEISTQSSELFCDSLAFHRLKSFDEQDFAHFEEFKCWQLSKFQKPPLLVPPLSTDLNKPRSVWYKRQKKRRGNWTCKQKMMKENCLILIPLSYRHFWFLPSKAKYSLIPDYFGNLTGDLQYSSRVFLKSILINFFHEALS